MLILLPPSEGKTVPRRGRPLDPTGWPPGLAVPRRAVVAALGDAARRPDAHEVLGIPASMSSEVDRDARLLDQPTAPAETVYSGVLYEALGLASLTGPARRRARARIGIQSALFGLVRPAERIPAYRLSGDTTLPGLGGVAAHWRAHLDPVMREAIGSGLLVDLRSGMYAAFWRPGTDVAVATVRVLHGGKVVSHFNKATKGRIVRALVEDGANPRTPAEFAEALRDLGWTVEPGPRAGTFDVLVSQV